MERTATRSLGIIRNGKFGRRNEKAALKQDGLGEQQRLLTFAAQGEDRAQSQQAGKEDHAPFAEGGNTRCPARGASLVNDGAISR